MAPLLAGTLYSSVASLVAGFLIYVLAVSGMLFAKATPPGDLGLVSVTIVLVGFGLGGLVLRAARLKESAAAPY